MELIKLSVLQTAIRYTSDYISRKYALGKTSHMNPGSLEDWPITEQKPLFSLFGNVEELIGVTLMESHLMRPLKSTSGIYFAAEVTFESCQLCPREKCSGRRAPYEPELLHKYRQMSDGLTK